MFLPSSCKLCFCSQVRVRIRAAAAHIGSVYHALATTAAHDRLEDYTPDGSLELTVSIAEGELGTLATKLRDTTAGAATAELLQAT